MYRRTSWAMIVILALLATGSLWHALRLQGIAERLYAAEERIATIRSVSPDQGVENAAPDAALHAR